MPATHTKRGNSLASILAIDIGSTKISTLVAEVHDDKIQLTGAGIAKAQGLKKGSIVNIDLASKSIKASLNDAKRVAGVDLKRAVVSLSGAYVKSLNSYGIVNIPSKEISVKEINRAMQTALYNANVPVDYELLHALPYNFKVDEQDMIQDPVGMSGSRLEVSVHLIIAQKSSIDNLKKTIGLAGAEIENVVLSGYASGIAVLGEDEKDLGVCVIDIGGATSNMVVHLGNAIRYNDFLGVGGSHVTGDLSMALHTPLGVAEKVKVEYGSLNHSGDNVIELPVIGNEESTQQVSLEVVSNVIYARVEETLMILAKQLEKSGFKSQLGAGVVLTGGLTKVEGLREVAAPIFDNMPVRIAKPREIEGLFDSLRDPEFSTALGLLRYGAGEYTLYEIDSNKNLRSRYENVSEPETPVQAMDGSGGWGGPAKEEDIADLLAREQSGTGAQDGAKKLWRWLTQLF